MRSTLHLVPVPSCRPDAPRPRPFLKWAGGKSQLLPQLLARFPPSFRRYHEPFLGGGAVFFALEPRRAVLSDINRELVDAYRTIRDDVGAVIAELQRHRGDEEHFYRVRAQTPTSLTGAAAAARTIFLNRTCYNGLYRVNSKGVFNVPYGRYAHPVICNADNLRLVADALQDVKLCWEDSLVAGVGRRAEKGDLVYFDPPYDPISTTSSFTSYARGGFGRDEQAALAEVFGALAERGVHVVLSNSDTPLIRHLYARFRIEPVYARRAINSRADRRGHVREVIVTAA